MCTGTHANYLDCKKGHQVKTYHWCLKFCQYVLCNKRDKCQKTRILYSLTTGPCPKCELGYGYVDSDSSEHEEASDDDWATISTTEDETREPEP